MNSKTKKTKIHNVIMTLTMFGLLISLGIACAGENHYGGIASSVNKTPIGTTINANLTAYYNIPTATGNGSTYFYIGGYWFNQTEMINLPAGVVQYGQSPYACCDSSGSSVIPAPVNPLVIVGFVGVVIFFVWRRKK